MSQSDRLQKIMSSPNLALSVEGLLAERDTLIARIERLENIITKARQDSGWCGECETNTHPNWCKHSKAAGHDLSKRCHDPKCCGLGERPKNPEAKL